MPKRLIYGLGVNDANYEVTKYTDGKRVWICPYYQVWHSMFVRCYSSRHHKREPSYQNCIVCQGWKYFMTFRAWMETQDWQGKQLDKDLLGNGKLYSPETCCFVEQWLNKLFTDHKAKRGKWPIGVHYDKRIKKFISQISHDGKFKYLGCFDTPEEAHQVYLEAKRNYAIEKMKDYPNKRIKQAVLDKVNQPCYCEWC